MKFQIVDLEIIVIGLDLAIQKKFGTQNRIQKIFFAKV